MDNLDPTPEHDPLPRPAPTPTAPAPMATSVGLVVSGCSAQEATDLVAGLRGALPAGSRAEVIVLDDHASPTRRPLFEAMRDLPEPTHFVPRPDGGRLAELDALTATATCEFVLVPSGRPVPFASLTAALQRMWVDGADAAVVGPPPSDGARRRPGGEVQAVRSLAGDAADAAARVAACLGSAAESGQGRLVVLRRWVARWLLNETDRALDPVGELADRGRLLGFALAELPAG